VSVPDGAETFVLVPSIEQREKERAMHDCFSRRVEDGLAWPGWGVACARECRLLERGRLEGQIGRFLALNARVAGRLRRRGRAGPQCRR
jgi:hypothetical protein